MKKNNFNYLIHLFALVFCFSSCVTHAQTKSTNVQTINGKKYYIHKVEKGQSLYAISKVYNMDVNSILTVNEDAIDGLKNGQELKIPVESLLNKSATTSLPIDTNKYVYHKVEKGQTIYAITKKYGIDEKKLNSYNPIITSGLKEGDYIIVGEKSKKTTVTNTNQSLANATNYTVLQSETLYGISKKFNVSTDDLIKWNPELKDGVKQGQIIKIAGNNKQPITTTTTTTTTSIVTTQLPISNSVTINNTPFDTTLFNKTKKNKYEVGLFLPFKFPETDLINLDELAKNKANFPQQQTLALDFYEGFKKAIDSVSGSDFEINLKLVDTDDRDSSKLEAYCKTSEFKNLDVAFGPIYSGTFKTVSAFAKTKGLPIVSPVLQQNKILYNNPLISKVTPSLFTMIESLADYCSDSLLNSAHFILVNTTTKDAQYISAFKNRFNENLLNHNRTLKDSITIVKGIEGVKKAYVPNKKNIVIALTNNPVYLQDFITQLFVFSDKKDFALFGFNNVSNIDNLDQEYLDKLNFHFASSNHIDYTDAQIIQLAKQYQDLHSTDATEYYFQGFDIGMYYLTQLKKAGPSLFLNLNQFKYDGASIDFKFYSPDKETGFENRAISIYKYANYKLQKLGWK